MKLNYKKPMMFYQEGLVNSSYYYMPKDGPRVRIVYPNGKIEWATLTGFMPDDRLHFNQKPCYLYQGKCNSAQLAIRKIRDFDRINGYPPMEFLGYL